MEKQTYDLLSRIFGKHKGVLMVVVLALGFGYPAGSDILQHIFTTGEEAPEWAKVINDNFDEIEARLTAIDAKLGPVLDYNFAEMVRYIDKKHQQVAKAPAEVLLIDLQHAVDTVWPAIPEDMKTPTLASKFELIEAEYQTRLAA